MSVSTDTSSRVRALDSARSFIVRAPAGSGKTGLLIQRYLKLLSQVDAPEEVVAITFTVKAAAEMRERVMDALASTSRAPTSQFEQTTGDLARAVNQRDRQLSWQLDEQPARLKIQTIDALCLSLVRQMAWMSNLGGEVKPVEDATAHYEQAAGEVFALLDDSEWQEPVSRVLKHLDNDVPKFRKMLVTMLARRDQWLRHLSYVDGDAQHMAVVLRRLTEQSLHRVRASIPPCAIEDVLSVAIKGGRIPSRETLPGGNINDLGDWLGIADALLTKQGEPRIQFSSAQGFPGAGDPDRASLKAALARVRAMFAENPGVSEQLQSLRALPPVETDEAHWEVLGALVQVLKVAVGLLRVVFGERSEVDFIELVGAAQNALGEPDNPTDLALSLDYRIRHILVDEFQDTSHNQIQLLERLTAGWEPDDGRTLFLVGDPMQSIYRFREADVGLYLDVRTRGLGALRPEPLTLTANFRSTEQVVRWVNETFSLLLPEAEDVATGAVTYSKSLPGAAFAEAGEVCVHALFDDDEDCSPDLIAGLIANELEREESSSIAVLVRARTHLRPVLAALRGAGITYQGVDLHPLALMPVVQDLLALTRALVYPADRIAWLAVLRAPWCGLTLADLLALMGKARDRSVLEVLRDSGATTTLTPDGAARVARLLGVFEGAFARRGRYRLRHWVEQTWMVLGGPVSVGEEELGDVDAFFDVLDTIDQHHAPDFDRLSTIVAERYSSGGASPARVEVMTIHAAKGLEFDTVILPSLERHPGSEKKQVLAWSETLNGTDSTELLLAPMSSFAEKQSALYNYLHQLEATRAHNEAARLLYVATTRARKRLHLIGTANVSKGKVKAHRRSLLGHLWPAVSGHFERSYRERRAQAPSDLKMSHPPALIQRVPLNWVNPLVGWQEYAIDLGPESIVFEWAGVAAKHVGTLVHRMLNIISETGVDGWSVERLQDRQARFERELRSLGVPREELQRAARLVADALITAVHDPVARWVLDPTHERAQSELAISGLVDGSLVNAVLDRTFVSADSTRWIIDYKTGRHSGGRLDEFLDRERIRYEPQLQRYAKLMANLDSRPIRLGLYFPMHGRWRECELPVL